MTIPQTDVLDAAPPPKPAPLWEDFIDIFHSPSEVYARRENANPWPMILIITVLFTLITAFTFTSLEGPIEAEARADAAKAIASNPQMTQDAADAGIRIQMVVRRWTGAFFPIGVLISALLVWILARLVGAKGETYQKAMVVVTYASIITVVQALVVGAQALVMDTSAMTTPDLLSLSGARFVDKAATSPTVYAVLKALDVFSIWSLVVMAIGVRVTGKATRSASIAFAVIWFSLTILLAAAMGARAAAAAGG